MPWRSHSAAAATRESTLGLSTPGQNYPTLMRMSQLVLTMTAAFSVVAQDHRGDNKASIHQTPNTQLSSEAQHGLDERRQQRQKTLQHDDPCFIWMHTATSRKSTATLDEHKIITSN